MAIPSSTEWEVRTTGHNDNGGGFCASYGGTDYSYQDDPQVVFDGSSITASTTEASDTITISGYTVSAQDAGNILNITGGDNFTTGRYCIIDVNTTDNTWQLDRTCCTDAASEMTGRMGGAVAHPGAIMPAAVDTNVVHIKAGTYDISSTSANVPDGRIVFSAARQILVGYQNARWDFGTQPLFLMSVATTAFANRSGKIGQFINLGVQATVSSSSTVGFDMGGDSDGGQVIQCTATDCYYGFNYYIYAYGCVASRTTGDSGSIGFRGCYFCYRCRALGEGEDYIGKGFYRSTAVECLAQYCKYGFCERDAARCVAANCQYGLNFSRVVKCLAYSCTYGIGDWIDGGGKWTPYAFDSISHTCSQGVGWGRLLNHAFYGCTTNYGKNLSSAGPAMYYKNIITPSADPLINASDGDYRLNNETGGGAVLNNAGVMPSVAGNTFETDVGPATEPLASEGGGGVKFFLPPRLVGG